MKTHKPSLILAFGLALIFFASIDKPKCQNFYDWSDKIPVTDSVSDNVHPYLKLLYTNDGQEYMNMVWEKSVDSLSTAIYFRNLLNSDEPLIVVSAPGIHFRNPKIMNLGGDTLFYVFYESDQNGNSDLFYSKFTTSGVFLGPFPLATTSEDEQNLCIGNEVMFDKFSAPLYAINTIAWTQNGALVTSDLDVTGNVYSFTEPVLVDPGSCSAPLMPFNGQLFWIRQDGENSWIYDATRIDQGNWTEPAVYYNDKNCLNLTGDKIGGGLIAWTSPQDNEWKMYLGSTYPYEPEIDSVEPVQDMPFEPGISSIIIGVRPEDRYIGEFYLAFPYSENNFEELFMNDGYYSGSGFWNFTNSSTDNRNPDFYLGENTPGLPSCFYVYLIWESYRNGHWQIFNSKTIMCVGGIDENTASFGMVKIWPNPFAGEVTIGYTLHETGIIKAEIFDSTGRSICIVQNGKQISGAHEFTWNGTDRYGNKIPRGLYVLRISNDDSFSSLRIVKN